MATLHTALKSLAPVAFSDVPTDQSALESWLSDLHSQSQIVIDSIPIPEATTQPSGPGSSSAVVAANASEVTPSSARSPDPAPDHQKLQKEWGKPLKLGAKENALGMSVYKLSGKDGRGAWFARRSVHEGLAFSRFKKALEMEFPESLAVQGAPGQGNVRGIGGETKVEDLKVPSKGRVEVYRLSAQFPGPTAPRDFVTLLVTSESAMKGIRDGDPVPRHYMIISKPCDHPETQPQSGFTRGFYESVEFIREVPRPINTSQSEPNLPQQALDSDGAGQEAMVKGSNQKSTTSLEESEAPTVTPTLKDTEDALPVEWIMVTRSDPGGSVPRFMVERGTPSSICADAEKFLNWACKQDFDEAEVAKAKDSQAPRPKIDREGFQSFRSSRVAGVDGESGPPQDVATAQSVSNEKEVIGSQDPVAEQQQAGGWMGALSGAAQYVSSYTPQVVLDHMPGSNTATPEQSREHVGAPEIENDAASTAASFESADSHLTGDSESRVAHISPSSSKISVPRKSEEHLNNHEKELLKLEQRRAALLTKFSESRSKLEKEVNEQTHKEESAQQKAAEKHDKELKRQQEKYEKELKKLEEKQEKERVKAEAKKRKQADKDEKTRLTRERDEARQELEIAKKEADVLRGAVEELQRENTSLVAKLGKAALSGDVSGDSRSSSRQGGAKKSRDRGLTMDSVSASVKSQ